MVANYNFELITYMLDKYLNWKSTVLNYNRLTNQNIKLNAIRMAYYRWVRKTGFILENTKYYQKVSHRQFNAKRTKRQINKLKVFNLPIYKPHNYRSIHFQPKIYVPKEIYLAEVVYIAEVVSF